jgi:hypothetical protein
MKEGGCVALCKPSLLSASPSRAVRDIKDATFTNNISRSFGNPTNKTLLHAARHNWIDVPGLTGKTLSLSQNPPLSTATSQGHLDLIRQGLRSTKPIPSLPPTLLPPPLVPSSAPSPFPLPLPQQMMQSPGRSRGRTGQHRTCQVVSLSGRGMGWSARW